MPDLTVTFAVTIRTSGDYYFDERDLARYADGWINGVLEDRDNVTSTEIRTVTPAERQMLAYALDLAQEEIHSRGDEFTDEDQEALDSLRRIANPDTEE